MAEDATKPRPGAFERAGAMLRRGLTGVGRLSEVFGRRSRRHVRAIAIGMGVLAVLSPVWSEVFRAGGRVLGGVRAGGVDVSRMERHELEAALAKVGRDFEKRTLGVRVGGKRMTLEPRELGFAIDVRATADRAFDVGRRANVLSRFAGAYARAVAPVDVALVSRIDAEAARKLALAWEAAALPDGPFAGGIKIDGDRVTALPPRAGRKLDVALTERVLRAALVANAPGDVELPVSRVPAPLPANAADDAVRDARALLSGSITLVSKEPEARVVLSPNELGTVLSTTARPPKILLDFAPERLEKILEEARKGIEKEALDAHFEIDAKETITITPSQAGLRIDRARLFGALLAAVARHDRTGELPLVFEPKPALTTEEAEHLGIKGLVSSFTTRHPCCEKRVENIHRIADLMNGRVVKPGETVSVNALVGPRTAKNGFVMAPTIEEGEMVDSLGGGISQFATTFFNALFHGGYEIVERQPHSYWFPRYPMGHEATLSWPKPDIIFKNDTQAGMVFKTSYTGTSITVKIYGDNGGRKVRAEVSGRQNVIDPPAEILPNPHVPPDEEKVKEPGSVGWSVIVSRFLTFPDGTKREDRRRVTYKPRTRRIEVHPCRIPKGEKGYTGERCPEPEDVEEIPETL